MAPLVGLVGGRLANRYWQIDSVGFKYIIGRNRLLVASLTAALLATLYAISERYGNKTPVTGRQRHVVFDNKTYEEISQLLFKVLTNAYKDKILSVNHKYSKRVKEIVGQLLESNKEFAEIREKDWSVYVIDDRNIRNAFVLPSGQIFVYTGLIKLCDNDHQLGTVLAHELSHALLGHGNEVLTQEVLTDLFQTIATFVFWLRLRPLRALMATVVCSVIVKTSLLLPRRRLIEAEADLIGLILSAKTCYDVREGSAFWMKMAELERQKWSNMFSTHPSSAARSEIMDTYMDVMIALMKDCNCPELSASDPRNRVKRKVSPVGRTVFPKIDK